MISSIFRYSYFFGFVLALSALISENNSAYSELGFGICAFISIFYIAFEKLDKSFFSLILPAVFLLSLTTMIGFYNNMEVIDLSKVPIGFVGGLCFFLLIKEKTFLFNAAISSIAFALLSNFSSAAQSKNIDMRVIDDNNYYLKFFPLYLALLSSASTEFISNVHWKFTKCRKKRFMLYLGLVLGLLVVLLLWLFNFTLAFRSGTRSILALCILCFSIIIFISFKEYKIRILRIKNSFFITAGVVAIILIFNYLMSRYSDESYYVFLIFENKGGFGLSSFSTSTGLVRIDSLSSSLNLLFGSPRNLIIGLPDSAHIDSGAFRVLITGGSLSFILYLWMYFRPFLIYLKSLSRSYPVQRSDGKSIFLKLKHSELEIFIYSTFMPILLFSFISGFGLDPYFMFAYGVMISYIFCKLKQVSVPLYV